VRYSGHDAHNSRGDVVVEPESLYGQLPKWKERADLDERLRVIDWRIRSASPRRSNPIQSNLIQSNLIHDKLIWSYLVRASERVPRALVLTPSVYVHGVPLCWANVYGQAQKPAKANAADGGARQQLVTRAC
jgi:hypothetical protein